MPSVDARKLDAACLAVWAAVLLTGLSTFRDYGVAWDEQGETVYGALLIKLYETGFRDRSAFELANFRFYGGGFELPSALIARALPWDEYATRHLLSMLVGLAALIATTRIARKLAGPRAALIAALLLALNPCWHGLSMIDARDIPMAAGLAVCLLLSLHMLDELPRIRWQTATLFGAVLGWTMSVRVGAVLALLFLSAPIALWLVQRMQTGAAWTEVGRDALRIAASLLAAAPVAYAVLAVFWPWAVLEPANPVDALVMFSRFPFEGTALFRGEIWPAKALPASYLPVYLAVTQPETLLAGVALAGVLLVRALVRGRTALDARALGIASVTFAAAFPVAYFVLQRPVAYNSMRHFLFVVPPCTVLAALAFDYLASRWLYAALALGLVHQASTLVALHPNQYLHFNLLAGGLPGALGRFELDYWGTSLREATERLVRTLEERGDTPPPDRPYRVYVCANVWSAAHFFPSWLTPTDDPSQADFHIALQQYYCPHQPDARPVLAVERRATALSWVDDVRGSHQREASACDGELKGCDRHGFGISGAAARVSRE